MAAVLNHNMGWLFFENGERIPLLDESDTENFRSTSKNWVFVWRQGVCLPPLAIAKSGLSYSRANDRYEFPDISGMNDWMNPYIIRERLGALQIPDAILANISTGGLLETCLKFPYLIDIFHFNDFQQGFNVLVEKSEKV